MENEDHMNPDQYGSAAPPSSAGDDTVGYKRPPKAHQFTKGKSGNPKGRPKKVTNSLVQAMAKRLDEKMLLPGTKRKKASTLQLMIRNLVYEAAKGDMTSIIEVIRLSELKDDHTGPNALYWHVTRYSNALAAKTPEELNEEFFLEQDRRIAEWKRELAEGGRSLRGMVEFELSRKMDGIRNGQKIKVTMGDAIVAAMLRGASKNPSVLKKVLKMLPTKVKKRDFTRFEIMRPTAEELMHCPAPGTSWDEWEEKKEQASN